MDEGKIQFFAVSYGQYSDYSEYYIMATSPNDALRRFMRSQIPYKSMAQVGTVWNADFDDHGVLHKTAELYDVEIPGDYLWERRHDENPELYKYRCKLCGDWRDEGDADRETFLNADRKCTDCAVLRQIEK